MYKKNLFVHPDLIALMKEEEEEENKQTANKKKKKRKRRKLLINLAYNQQTLYHKLFLL